MSVAQWNNMKRALRFSREVVLNSSVTEVVCAGLRSRQSRYMDIRGCFDASGVTTIEKSFQQPTVKLPTYYQGWQIASYNSSALDLWQHCAVWMSSWQWVVWSSSQGGGGGGGVLPYTGYIGYIGYITMCGLEGYGLLATLVINRVIFAP